MVNMGQMMKQMQKLQEQMSHSQEKVGALELTGSAGGGMVSVSMTGKGHVTKVTLHPDLIVPGEVDVLEDLIVAALHDVKSKMDQAVEEEMKKVTGGLSLPKGMNLPF